MFPICFIISIFPPNRLQTRRSYYLFIFFFIFKNRLILCGNNNQNMDECCINFACVSSLPSYSINKLFDNHKSNMLKGCEGVGQCGKPRALWTILLLSFFFLPLKSLCVLNESFDAHGSLPHTSAHPSPPCLSNNSASLIISPSVLPRKCLNVIFIHATPPSPRGRSPERAHCPTHLVFLPWDTCRHL